jgi:hypothetical protein
MIGGRDWTIIGQPLGAFLSDILTRRIDGKLSGRFSFSLANQKGKFLVDFVTFVVTVSESGRKEKCERGENAKDERGNVINALPVEERSN